VAASERIVAMSRRPLLAALAAVFVVSLTIAPAADTATRPGSPRVLLAFLPVDEKPLKDPTLPRPTILDALDQRKQLALGLSGATQGRYEQAQALLDITQGTRVSRAAYDPRKPPDLAFYAQGRGGLFQGWLDANERADSAPADIVPGLLGQNVPGGTAYAGVVGRSQLEAMPAVDRAGRIDRVSIGPARDLAARAQRLLERKRFVVAGLPTEAPGEAAVDALIATRAPDELLIVMQTPPDFRAPQLLPTGIAGLGKPGALTSDTTRLQGVVAGIDVLPTVLDWLGVKVPDEVKGQPIRVEGKRDAAALKQLTDRLRVVAPRRFPALETVLATWLGVLLTLALFADRRGARAAMRIGALALLWILPVLLVTAALHPSRTAELAVVAVGTFALAIVTDLALPWPRGPVLPAAVAVVTYVADLADGSDLIIRSLLGPNPRFGSRYYGIGNELEATLPILMFIALAVLTSKRGRSREGALAFGVSGLLLGAAVGSGRLGADVGGVLTIGAGTAVAVLFMLPGGVTRRSLVLAVLAPVLALVGLAGLDLATGGNGHFTRTVLHANGESALQDIIVRRYELAFNVLKRGLMPFATAIAILTIAYGLRYRDRIFAPLGGNAAWTAALAGSLASAVAGTLFNDSGPLLLIFGAFVLATVAVYVRGDPRLAFGPVPPRNQVREAG
jgi:hypothetical protein